MIKQASLSNQTERQKSDVYTVDDVVWQRDSGGYCMAQTMFSNGLGVSVIPNIPGVSKDLHAVNPINYENGYELAILDSNGKVLRFEEVSVEISPCSDNVFRGNAEEINKLIREVQQLTQVEYNDMNGSLVHSYKKNSSGALAYPVKCMQIVNNKMVFVDIEERQQKENSEEVKFGEKIKMQENKKVENGRVISCSEPMKIEINKLPKLTLGGEYELDLQDYQNKLSQLEVGEDIHVGRDCFVPGKKSILLPSGKGFEFVSRDHLTISNVGDGNFLLTSHSSNGTEVQYPETSRQSRAKGDRSPIVSEVGSIINVRKLRSTTR